MDEIPMPELLDPSRMLINDRGNMNAAGHAQRAELLDRGLHESCEYAQELWQALDRVRHYLHDSLPPDPRAPSPRPRQGASPTGPDDDTGWKAWMEMFAMTNSVLTGPQGDSGYGLNEARREAQLRRTAPVLMLPAAENRGPRNSGNQRAASPLGRAETVRLGLAAAGAFLLATLVRRPPQRTAARSAHEDLLVVPKGQRLSKA